MRFRGKVRADFSASLPPLTSMVRSRLRLDRRNSSGRVSTCTEAGTPSTRSSRRTRTPPFSTSTRAHPFCAKGVVPPTVALAQVVRRLWSRDRGHSRPGVAQTHGHRPRPHGPPGNHSRCTEARRHPRRVHFLQMGNSAPSHETGWCTPQMCFCYPASITFSTAAHPPTSTPNTSRGGNGEGPLRLAHRISPPHP